MVSKRIYNTRMRRTLMDKLFFLDKINTHIIVDFGCADASMLKVISEIRPDLLLFGYDNNTEMVEVAKKNTVNHNNIIIFSGYADLLRTLQESYPDYNKTIVLSSILHEVKDKEEFAKSLELDMYNYVVVRDFYLNNPNESISEEDIKILDKIPAIIKVYYTPLYLRIKKFFIQAMMKSAFLDNLDKEELDEDYFSVESLTAFSRHRKIAFVEYSQLSFWKDYFQKEFEYDLGDEPTHIKAIFEK